MGGGGGGEVKGKVKGEKVMGKPTTNPPKTNQYLIAMQQHLENIFLIDNT